LCNRGVAHKKDGRLIIQYCFCRGNTSTVPKGQQTRKRNRREILIMIRSGEWFGAQALNMVRHRMGSRHAIDIVAAHRSSQQSYDAASRAEGKTTLLRAIAAIRPLRAAA
jgi:hypothetical protein